MIEKLTRCKTFKAKSCFPKNTKIQKWSFSRSKRHQELIYWTQTFFRNLTCVKTFNSKSNALFFSVQSLTRCNTFMSKSDAFKKFYFKSWRVWKLWFKIWQVAKVFLRNMIWFLSCLSLFDRKIVSIVNVKTKLFWRGELKDNDCYRFSRHMYIWKLPQVISPLNLERLVLWQTLFSQRLWTEFYGALNLANQHCSRKTPLWKS